MDLEKRVKTLEDELKILKNQIQNTLLDIQESIVMRASDLDMDDLAGDNISAVHFEYSDARLARLRSLQS